LGPFFNDNTSHIVCRSDFKYTIFTTPNRAILTRFSTVYVYPFSAQNLRFVIVDVVSNFLSNTKEKSQQNQPLAFLVSNKLLTININ